MKKVKETIKFANMSVEEFQAALNEGENVDSPEVIK